MSNPSLYSHTVHCVQWVPHSFSDPRGGPHDATPYYPLYALFVQVEALVVSKLEVNNHDRPRLKSSSWGLRTEIRTYSDSRVAVCDRPGDSLAFS